MQRLTLNGFENLLERRNRTEPVTIMTRTEPKMKSGRKDKETGEYPNPFITSDKESKVERLALRNYFIGASYESVVNRQRVREDHGEYFTAEELWGGHGERVNKFVVRHKGNGKLYLACKAPNQRDNPGLADTIESRYQWKDTGLPLTEDEETAYKEWLPKPSASKRQETDKAIHWRTVELKNIEYVRIGGREYTLDIKAEQYAA